MVSAVRLRRANGNRLDSTVSDLIRTTKMEREKLLPTAAIAILLMTLLAGCSSTPTALRDAPRESPLLSQVRAQPEAYVERRLRWGGTIATIENLPQTTRIEVVARRLTRNGEPIQEDRSEGRFLAQFDHFLDPGIYTTGRAITLVGRFVRMEKRQLDQMLYNYPLLRVESYHLWPEPEPYHDHYDPFWHDPLFYDPWYPFGYPYPYYPYHYWPHRH